MYDAPSAAMSLLRGQDIGGQSTIPIGKGLFAVPLTIIALECHKELCKHRT